MKLNEFRREFHRHFGINPNLVIDVDLTRVFGGKVWLKLIELDEVLRARFDDNEKFESMRDLIEAKYSKDAADFIEAVIGKT